MEKVCLPELGEQISEATVVEIHCHEGMTVSKDDDLVELVTDKASFNVSSPVSGVVRKVNVKSRDQVAIGTILVEISPGGTSA